MLNQAERRDVAYGDDRVCDPLSEDLEPFFREESREGFSRQHSESAYEYIQSTQLKTVAS